MLVPAPSLISPDSQPHRSTSTHTQVLYEAQLEGGDTLGMQDAMIQRLAEKDPQYYGAQLAGTLTVANRTAAGAIKDIKFLDTDTCFWQLTQQQSMQHKSSAADLIPYLGEPTPLASSTTPCMQLYL